MLAATSAAAAPPSLAKRPVEDRTMAEPVRDVLAPAPADTALKARIDGLVAQGADGQRAFDAQLPQARVAAASAGNEGSEGWIAAQQSLSALEAARTSSTAALSEIDTLIATRLAAGSDDGLTELRAADDRLIALTVAQQKELDSLRSRLSR